jgi:serine phosphatase RsbU (regulator of sigma subunit)
VLPRSYPRLPGIDYHVSIEPYKGCVGGDHVILVNFREYKLKQKIAEATKSGNTVLAERLKKNLDSFGILIADVAGHMISDSVTVNYLHGAFKTGIIYELNHNGEITQELFEIVNSDLYTHMQPDYLQVKPYTTLQYGEIHSDGRFRFLSAGHPPPIIFSNEFNKIQMLGSDRTKTSTPLGVLPGKFSIDTEHFGSPGITNGGFDVNEIHLLGHGDIMLLYTDGLIEHKDGTSQFKDTRLENILRETKDESAEEICDVIRKELYSFCTPEDDLTLAIIKKVQWHKRH